MKTFLVKLEEDIRAAFHHAKLIDNVDTARKLEPAVDLAVYLTKENSVDVVRANLHAVQVMCAGAKGSDDVYAKVNGERRCDWDQVESSMRKAFQELHRQGNRRFICNHCNECPIAAVCEEAFLY